MNDPQSTVYHGDCMEFMAQFPDNYFELAIVDPPYGASFLGPCGRFEKYGGLDSVNKNPPSESYFTELWRVSKNSIIWGGNYFNMPPCKCFIIWDKKQPQTASYAQAEYAWTNLIGTSKIFEKRVIGADFKRIHPTQKPVALYEWLLKNYAKEGDKILDTHMGSQSSRIAAYKYGFDYWGSELDEDYFKSGSERFERESKQPMLLKI
jgi:site-specific DNA-methyltransferase (adenine-specific)